MRLANRCEFAVKNVMAKETSKTNFFEKFMFLIEIRQMGMDSVCMDKLGRQCTSDCLGLNTSLPKVKFNSF